MRILVTGKNGQLGSELQVLSSGSEHTFFFTGREELDITQKSAIKSFVSDNNISAIINCAAYTAVDNAEDDSLNAFMVNDTSVQYLSEVCEEDQVRLIHISTDYVFNGESEAPYNTNDPVDPIGIYGQSKRAGELHVLQSSSDSVVIRTSWVYSTFGNNFVKTMLRLGSERDELNVVADQNGCPTYAKDLAKAILEIIGLEGRLDQNQKVYHFSNKGIISWFDFANKIFELSTNVTCKVNPITTDKFPTKAKRPKYSVLDTSEFEQDFSINIRTWEEALRDCIQLLENN